MRPDGPPDWDTNVFTTPALSAAGPFDDFTTAATAVAKSTKQLLLASDTLCTFAVSVGLAHSQLLACVSRTANLQMRLRGRSLRS